MGRKLIQLLTSSNHLKTSVKLMLLLIWFKLYLATTLKLAFAFSEGHSHQIWKFLVSQHPKILIYSCLANFIIFNSLQTLNLEPYQYLTQLLRCFKQINLQNKMVCILSQMWSFSNVWQYPVTNILPSALNVHRE